jgi:hypothetical protein
MRPLYAFIISSLSLLSALILRRSSIFLINNASISKTVDQCVLSNKQRNFFRLNKKVIPKASLFMLYESAIFVLVFPIILTFFLIFDNAIIAIVYFWAMIVYLMIRTIIILLTVR